MKIEEAKTKMCPFIHSTRDEYVISGQVMSNIFCICSDCMAWVWDENGHHTTGQNGTVWHEGYCARIGNEN